MAERFTGTIRDISSQGLGVVDHPDGRAFFVADAWPGDSGLFEIESLKKKYGFAKWVERHTDSPDRVPNPCPHAGRAVGKCGGCPWLAFDYQSQLKQKQKKVEYLFQRQKLGTSQTQTLPIHGSPDVWGYRNRAQFKTDGHKIGYVSSGTKVIAPVEDCLILNPQNRDTLLRLRHTLPRADWEPAPPYLWNFIEVDDDLTFEETVLNRRRPFKQANTQQNEFMKSWVAEKLNAESPASPVLELFCGSGNFTRVLSDKGFASITAIEVEKSAVEKLNSFKWPGVRGLSADLFKEHRWNFLNEVKESELLLLDPPREGFEALGQFVKRLPRLRKILYISCDLQTLANDLKDLQDQGWALVTVQPVDQFPHTPHVEILVEIVKT